MALSNGVAVDYEPTAVGGHAEPDVEPTPQATERLPVPEPAAATAGGTPPALAYLNLLTRLHEEFVVRQAEVHHQFLQLNQAAAALAHLRFSSAATASHAPPGAPSAPPSGMPTAVPAPRGLRRDRPQHVRDPAVDPAVRDHVARLARVHPGAIDTAADSSQARPVARPLEVHRVQVGGGRDPAPGRSSGPPRRDFSVIRDWWRQRLSTPPGWPGEDLYHGLAEQFLDHVVYADPGANAAVRGRACLYLANHQVGVESVVFAVVASALAGTPVLAVLKDQQPQGWIGRFVHDVFSYPGVGDPGLIVFLDRSDPAYTAGAVAFVGARLAAGMSVLVHIDGTRARSSRQRANQLNAALLDVAVDAGAPVVPVRFTRGLPVVPASHRLEFPVGYGRQEYWVGPPLRPADLAGMTDLERKATVLGAVNGLGPGPAGDQPAEADPAFAARVDEWVDRTGAAHEDAVVFTALAGRAEPTPAIRLLLDGAQAGRLVVADDPASRWLGRLAQRLYGPRGPEVVQL
jgi:1-acyl-sn-glycerol-3-phosphate acyltransferase